MKSEVTTIVKLTLTGLAAAPLPISGPIIKVIEQIWAAVDQTSQNKHQIELLFSRICQVLISLKVPQNYSDDALQGSLKLLISNLESILGFVRGEQRKSFLRAVLTADDLKLKIEEHERSIVMACLAFQNAAILSTNKRLEDLFELLNSQDKRKSVRAAQQEAYMLDISDRLAAMQVAVTYPSFLDTLLGTVQANPIHMLTAMQAVLERDAASLGRQEKDFLTAGIERLREQTAMTSKIEIHSWTVTSFEVERGYLLGSDETLWVRLGRWKQKVVLIFDLKDDKTVEEIVQLWEPIRNDHIRTFVGASVHDNPPFVLIPNGGILLADYLENQKTTINIVKIALDIAIGLEHLHNLKPSVAHGGVRSANIFVDDHGNVSLILPGIRNSQLFQPIPNFSKLTERWTAPELISKENGDQRFSSEGDIFAWGVVVEGILDAVVHDYSESDTPPTKDEQITFMRQLIARCKNPDSSNRPTSREICSMLYNSTPETDRPFFVAMSSQMDEDDAEGWRMVHSSSSLVASFLQWDDYAYVTTPPIGGVGDAPLKKLCFELKCHDQGAARTSASPRDGTWCWVELAIIRSGDDGDYEVNIADVVPGHFRGHMVDKNRHEVLRCPFGDSTPRTHRVTFDHQHPLVEIVRKGDRLKLYPKARFPGWEIYMYYAEIQVISQY